MAILSDFSQFLDTFVSFPQLSFLRPIIASVVLLLVVDLTYKLAFTFFRRFFE